MLLSIGEGVDDVADVVAATVVAWVDDVAAVVAVVVIDRPEWRPFATWTKKFANRNQRSLVT